MSTVCSSGFLLMYRFFFFFNDTATTEIYTLSLHDALPIWHWYNDRPRLVSADFIHPYPAGGKRIATVFTREIGAGLNRFKLRQLRQMEVPNHITGAVR